VIIENERKETANYAAHVEDGPENREVDALAVLLGIGGQDGALGCPEKSSSDPEDCSSNNDEELAVDVVVIEKRAGVEDVGRAGGDESAAGAEDIVDSTAEDAEDGESGVQSGVGVVCCIVIHLAAAAHAGERVEHPRPAETHKPIKHTCTIGEWYRRTLATDPVFCSRPSATEDSAFSVSPSMAASLGPQPISAGYSSS
jgi:hypothetical protein